MFTLQALDAGWSTSSDSPVEAATWCADGSDREADGSRSRAGAPNVPNGVKTIVDRAQHGEVSLRLQGEVSKPKKTFAKHCDKPADS